MVAYYLQSKSEAGEAPYGDHVVLAPRYLPFGQYYSETIFAAYCVDELQYRWLDNQKLSIKCEAEKVIKKSGSYKDLTIEYQIPGDIRDVHP